MDREPPAETPLERLVMRDVEEHRGSRISERSRMAQRSVDAYLRAGIRPRWMERIDDIERGTAAARRRIERAYAALRSEYAGDPDGFARAWSARARSWRFDDLNEIIRQHNEWYPIERDLPMNPRTRDYVLIAGRSFRREELGPEWILARFPAEL